MIQFVKTFCGNEKAATAIEYGLIAAGIAIAIIAAVGLRRRPVVFDALGSVSLTSALPSGGTAPCVRGRPEICYFDGTFMSRRNSAHGRRCRQR